MTEWIDFSAYAALIVAYWFPIVDQVKVLLQSL